MHSKAHKFKRTEPKTAREWERCKHKKHTEQQRNNKPNVKYTCDTKHAEQNRVASENPCFMHTKYGLVWFLFLSNWQWHACACIYSYAKATATRFSNICVVNFKVELSTKLIRAPNTFIRSRHTARAKNPSKQNLNNSFWATVQHLQLLLTFHPSKLKVDTWTICWRALHPTNQTTEQSKPIECDITTKRLIDISSEERATKTKK